MDKKVTSRDYEKERKELFGKYSKFIDPKVQEAIDLIEKLENQEQPKHKVINSQTGTSS